MQKALFRKCAGVLAISAASLVSTAGLSPAAMAAAPMVKTQAPGYYRVMLGEFEVTALYDGSLDLPVEKLLKQPAEKTLAELNRNFLKSPVTTSINAYLVNTGKKLILFDTGSIGSHGPTTGHLLENLRAAGYKPEDVDDVFITHSHWDHAEGLSKDGHPNFPNAVVHLGKADVDYYLGHVSSPNDSEAEKEGFDTATAAYGPYQSAGKLKTIDAAGEVSPGITAISSPGHTPGHTSYLVESQGKKLIVAGDLIHVDAVQLEDPSVTIVWDSNAKAAAASRQKVFAEAASENALIAAAHLPFPGIGHLKASGKSWHFSPIEPANIK